MKVGKARQTARRSMRTTTKTVRSCLQDLAIYKTDRDRTTAPGANSDQVSQPRSTAEVETSPAHLHAPPFKGPPGGP